MNVLAKWLSNHVLANLTFALVIILGAITYSQMPREQDPTINFNWIQITTLYPGASAQDIETRVTEIIEDSIRNVSDIRFASSISRDSVSSILVRFNDIPEKVFEKRLTDLRREIQNIERKLPKEAERPEILELTSSNAFPSATVAVVGNGDESQLRNIAKNVQKDLEQMKGIDRVDALGLRDPELQTLFFPETASQYQITPEDIANSIAAHYQDQSAGSIRIDNSRWLVRWLGTDPNPQHLSRLPVLSAEKDLPLDEIAYLQRGRDKANQLVSYQDHDTIMLSVMKKSNTNVLKLVDSISQYLADTNKTLENSGVQVVLLDDQTQMTRDALDIMQNNALLGLFLVLGSTWLFLGLRIAAIVAVGIPFTLAATFITLSGLEQTLNVSVLLGVVICLGMLVDDSVVVVEAIYYRLSRGQDKMKSTLEALKEVFAPVTASVLTTIAAFLPLMLLPGILGKFMMVIPLVVCLALLFSLIEAYWMLPAHINSMPLSFDRPSSIQKFRNRATHLIRIYYVRLLIKIMRFPKATFGVLGLLFIFLIGSLSLGLVKFNFFASDPIRLFYVNVEMNPGTPVDQTLEQVKHIEHTIRQHLELDEARAVASYSGIMFTETEPFIGEQYGQVLVSLNPKKHAMREVDDVINATREAVMNTPGPKKISYLRLAGGPPTTSPINVKVRGDNFDNIRLAVVDLKTLLNDVPSIRDIVDNDTVGQPELLVKPNPQAIHHAGLSPSSISRTLRLLVDGEIVSQFQHEGDELNVRVKNSQVYQDLESFLQTPISSKHGNSYKLKDLIYFDTQKSQSSIRHYNFRKAISVSADIDKDHIDTVAANNIIKAGWQSIAFKHPTIQLDFSGELDDIEESIQAMPKLFLIGLGLMYLILGTQFRSYWQPLMILITVPLAFCGVLIGLLVTRNPMSLFTLYGVVALSGIAVNSAIVLISAANDRLQQGMSLMPAVLYAARRRVIPVLITSMTTIAGLFSLATGLGGKSLLWGPVATAIVWGLLFSTALTLLVVPLVYKVTMHRSWKTSLSS